METVGVEAVVEGLLSYMSDMDKVQGKIDDLGSSGSILGNIFDSITGIIGDFGREVLNVAEVALGVMLRDALEGIISAIGELISKTIEAGNEFQTLTLRLNGMNLNDLAKSGMDYNKATEESIKLTQEQLSWLQKLAAATPYDNTDISLTYSLARSYGFIDQEARNLTETTADFASSMGLSGDTLERIIRNFGQMKARGKITGTELRDLARGAFVPLDDVLGRIAKKMGITTTELTKLISAPKGGVDWKLFTDAFQEMVAEEPRFTGASERMARTFKSASDNVMDLATSFGGLNIATPILDVLGGRIADFMDQFIKSDTAGQSFTELGKRLLDASVKVGDALSGIVSDVLGLLPDSKTLAEGLISGLEGIANWLTTNKDTIVNGVRDIFQGFNDFINSDMVTGILGFLKSIYDQLFLVNQETGYTGWEELAFSIGNVATAIGNVLKPLLDGLNIDLPSTKTFVEDLINALNNFAAWIDKNQENLRILVEIIVALLIIQLVTVAFWSFVATVASAVVSALLFVASLGAMVQIILNVVAVVGIIIAAIVSFAATLVFMQWTAELVVHYIENLWLGFQQNTTDTFNRIIEHIKQLNWIGVGIDIVMFVLQGFKNSIDLFFLAAEQAGRDVGKDIIAGMTQGVTNNASQLVGALVSAAMSAYNAAKAALGIQSPSTLFAGIGENLMAGMAEGIANSTGLAVAAMQNAVSAVSMPAISMQSSQAAPSSISSTYQTSVVNNLTINSNAQSEQVAADFAMMSSLAGV